MGGRGNGVLPNAHFRKPTWQKRVKVWFDAETKAKKREQKRIAKAAKLAPRPVKKLRPIVHCPTVRYNMKKREGRGFTLEELEVAGIKRYYAASIGITVDARRRNKSEESLKLNSDRLKAYMSKLVLLPGNGGPEVQAKAVDAKQVDLNEVFPFTPIEEETGARKITQEMRDFEAAKTLQEARQLKKTQGKREKEAKEAAKGENEK